MSTREGQQCIPYVVLKNEGAMVQTHRNMNVQVVNRYILKT